MMFFCRAGRLAASLLFVFGASLAAMGIYLAVSDIPPSRYFPVDTTGEVITHGMLYMGVAMLAGMIAEIGLVLRGTQGGSSAA